MLDVSHREPRLLLGKSLSKACVFNLLGIISKELLATSADRLVEMSSSVISSKVGSF